MKKGEKKSKAKAKPPASKRARGWRAVRPFFVAIGTFGVVFAGLYGLNNLGQHARQNVGDRTRYESPFADIECPAPVTRDRIAFLAEVRQLSGFPETFQRLDPETIARLQAAFAAHPWVEAVEGVALEPQGRVQIRLKFRTPVLAVSLIEAPGTVRLVDGNGVLLPISPLPPAIAELGNPRPKPATADGKPWADEIVQRAVELVKAYQPRRLEKVSRGWRLVRPDGQALLVGW